MDGPGDDWGWAMRPPPLLIEIEHVNLESPSPDANRDWNGRGRSERSERTRLVP